MNSSCPRALPWLAGAVLLAAPAPAVAFPFPWHLVADVAEGAALVRQLSAPRYADRERAETRLKELPAARPFLEDALRNSTDAELVGRGKKVLAAWDRKTWPPALKRFFADPKALPADAAIGYLTTWPGPVEGDDLWTAALGYAEALRSQGIGRRENYPATRLSSYTRTPYATRQRLHSAAPADLVIVTLAQVTGGRMTMRSLSTSVLLSQRPVEVTSLAECCVIVADGDVTLGTCQHALILAAGKVTLTGDEHRMATVLARGEIDARSIGPKSDLTLYSPAGVGLNPDGAPRWVRVLTEKSAPAVRGLWSAPDLLGLDVKAGDGGLAVAAVKPDSLAAKAGLKAGDVVERAGGEPVKAPADLMRFYWRGGPAGECPVRLKRGGKAVEVTLPVRPPEK